jgi:P27 family predicted phage terminase small subunit
MAKPGPKPKPTKLQVLRGNPGKKSKKQLEEADAIKPPVLDETMTPPDYLDDEAVREWNRVAPILIELGLMTEVDTPALAIYCGAYARYTQAARQLNKEKLVTTYKTGATAQNTLIGVMNTAAKTMKEFMVEFGMTPSARTRIKLPEKPKPDARASAL